MQIGSDDSTCTREFQELGETLNTLGRSLTGFQPKRRRRQKRRKTKEGLEGSKSDSADRKGEQNREDIGDTLEVVPSSMTTTINTTTEEIQKQTMAGINKVRKMGIVFKID